MTRVAVLGKSTLSSFISNQTEGSEFKLSFSVALQTELTWFLVSHPLQHATTVTSSQVYKNLHSMLLSVWYTEDHFSVFHIRSVWRSSLERLY